MNKYIVEFIGTFFLVLAIALAEGEHAAMIISTTLIAMIYAGGHISKAHYNPAVTFAFWLLKDLPTSDIAGYLIGQLLGAFSAIAIAFFLNPGLLEASPFIAPISKILIGECIGTFALVFVILNVAIGKGTAGNSFYGIAIGLTVWAGILLFGEISGAVFNPAVLCTAIFCGHLPLATIWVYLIAHFIAAAIAAFTFKQVNRLVYK